MGAGEIIKLIVEYGIYPVLMGILLWVMLAIQKRQNKASEEQEKRLTELIDTSIKFAIKDSRRHSAEEEEESRRVTTYVKTQMDAIISENKANRAFCVAYHNGGTYLNARNFAKCSIVAESVDNQTRPFMLDYQNVQRALFVELDNKLAKDGECYISDIETLKDKVPGSYHLLSRWGTNAIYFKALIDNTNDMVLGFIAAEFNAGPPKDEEALKLCLSKKAQRISGAIQFSHTDVGHSIEGGADR